MSDPLDLLKRTKIVATLGPSTDSPKILTRMISAGLDVVRLNFSHGSAEEHRRRVEMVRMCAKQAGRAIGIMADLQGPKIRIACFKQGFIILETGASFILDAQLDSAAGDEHKVGIDYANLPNDVQADDHLLLDDGRLVLVVEQVKNAQIHCRVLIGGRLSNHKGINRQGGGLSAPALTEKDYQDLIIAVELKCDYIAVSFPRNAEDMQLARKAITQAGGTAGLIAKIERSDALPYLDAIIKASEGVMVARGDLGVEIGDAEVPAIQKHIIHQARALNKIVITATQMMESMIHNAIPTRAEVSDVANAVLDGTDAVMLSAETATGRHPDRVIESMARVCYSAEKQPRSRLSHHRVDSTFDHAEEAVAMAAMYIANHHAIKAIIAFTETGLTPLWMSRIRSGIPIYGITASHQTEQKMTLIRGVYPVYQDFHAPSEHQMQTSAIALLKSKQCIQTGDRVLVTYGCISQQGGTNTLQLLEVT